MGGLINKMQSCFLSFFTALLFAILLKNLLLVSGLKLTKGNADRLVKILLAFDLILILTSWFLYAMTSGVCS